MAAVACELHRVHQRGREEDLEQRSAPNDEDSGILQIRRREACAEWLVKLLGFGNGGSEGCRAWLRNLRGLEVVAAVTDEVCGVVDQSTELDRAQPRHWKGKSTYGCTNVAEVASAARHDVDDDRTSDSRREQAKSRLKCESTSQP